MDRFKRKSSADSSKNSSSEPSGKVVENTVEVKDEKIEGLEDKGQKVVFIDKNNTNYAQLYKQAMDKGDIDGSLKILGQWDKEIDRFEDTNYLLAMINYSVLCGKPRNIIEMYIKLIPKSNPVDDSLYPLFAMLAKTSLISQGYEDLSDEF